eukprot:s625_g16.t1
MISHAGVDMFAGSNSRCLDRRCRNLVVWIGYHLRQCPEDVVKFLKQKLQRLFEDRPEDVHVEHVTNIRDFNKEIPDSAKIYNIFRKRKDDDDANKVIPHSFTFVRRERHLGQI